MRWFRNLFPVPPRSLPQDRQAARRQRWRRARPQRPLWCGSGKKYKKAICPRILPTARGPFAAMTAKNAKARSGGDGITRSRQGGRASARESGRGPGCRRPAVVGGKSVPLEGFQHRGCSRCLPGGHHHGRGCRNAACHPARRFAEDGARSRPGTSRKDFGRAGRRAQGGWRFRRPLQKVNSDRCRVRGVGRGEGGGALGADRRAGQQCGDPPRQSAGQVEDGQKPPNERGRLRRGGLGQLKGVFCAPGPWRRHDRRRTGRSDPQRVVRGRPVRQLGQTNDAAPRRA